jgi:hypothetical protein
VKEAKQPERDGDADESKVRFILQHQQAPQSWLASKKAWTEGLPHCTGF